jgi:glyoxylase-like metal-dependent hydrolase (beta-lactamase superfamily II)
MELYTNTFQIQSLYGSRNLFQYLFVGENVVLVDAGIAETPARAIFPYFDTLKLDPRRLSLVVITHPDLDHQGGNRNIKAIASQARLACGEADRHLIEDPRTLFDQRYNFAKKEHGLGFSGDDPWPEAGQPQKIDIGFSGGETIRVDEGWELDVLHVPGHSHGHLALYDTRHKAAFVSDAIHGRGCPNADGSMGIPVAYFYVDIYLSTLRYFEGLAIDVLYSGHWPAMRGEEVSDFISTSRATVDLLDRVILRNLGATPAGLTLQELVDVAANAVGDWPKDTWFIATYPVLGHVDRLERREKVRRVPGIPHPKWQLV